MDERSLLIPNFQQSEQYHSGSIQSSQNFSEFERYQSESEMNNPESEQPQTKRSFSWSRLWYFTGPGFLMSIAYLDPGNIESDLQSGAVAQYKLLWVLFSAHILGLLLQRLAAQLGVVTGKDMAEMAYSYYPKLPRLFLWIMIEIAIICSDMQEVIGTAIAFYLLSKGWIPLFAGVLITMCDTFTFLVFDQYGIRRLEFLFGVLITTMAVTFGFEFIEVNPDKIKMFEGMFIPWCSDCGLEEFKQAISVVGAVIMPHNLYLHSALVKSRKIDRKIKEEVTEANYYYFIESAVALSVSFFINVFVVAVFAHGLFQKTNVEILETCVNSHGIFDKNAFPNNTERAEVDIYRGGIFLGCEFGVFALYVWAVGIMAAGQSSTMTGTYAGQFVMEGFLNIQWPRWKRVLITRSIAILPTLSLAFATGGVKHLTGMNDLLNCVQMIQLPFALLPIITFTSHTGIMYEYVSSKAFQIFALIVAALVLSINFYFSFDYITSSLGTEWYAWLILTIPGFIYLMFVIYLVLVCLYALEWFNSERILPKLWLPSPDFTNDAPWRSLPNDSSPSPSPPAYVNYGAN
uniref:Uncharacterized protein n=1 Tax=Panagrolaimus sp. PS1159 TaxID=55785 RepID=A0AC35F9G3_9BILA